MTNRILGILIVCSTLFTAAWGVRGHRVANLAAVRTIPADGPVFLKEYEDWISKTGPVPDSWRGATEPYSKIFEDPNHGWFKEQFSFMQTVPRSRYEFVLRLHDEYLRIKQSDPETAKLTNVRWTGTMPYAAMENFDRMKSSMRYYRQFMKLDTTEAKQNARYFAQDIAFYMGWLGHYTADGAQPLHDTIHHDGWQGPNPQRYTTDPRIHGRFESKFVDDMNLSDADIVPLVSEAKVLDDPFATIVRHLDDASTHVEEIYKMDNAGAFADAHNAEATKLVKSQLAKAAALLRDLTYTAWIQSAQEPLAAKPDPQRNPISPMNPQFNPETGSAPPSGPPVPLTVKSH